MKTIWIILAIVILTAGESTAQTVQDSAAVKRNQAEKQLQQQQMVDENADGIDDAQQQKGKKFKNKKDKFIDRDGDGICDDRASGLGWRLGGKNSMKQGGQKKGPRGRQ
jgi:type II secretory pathway pseudopilin PulG